MTPLTLAKKYMEVFYESGDFESLYEIFDQNIIFVGPLYKFDNAKDYINSLIGSPPIECTFKIMEEYETEGSACLIYEFSKNGKTTLMSQSFSISGDKINQIRLIFNVGDIT